MHSPLLLILAVSSVSPLMSVTRYFGAAQLCVWGHRCALCARLTQCPRHPSGPHSSCGMVSASAPCQPGALPEAGGGRILGEGGDGERVQETSKRPGLREHTVQKHICEKPEYFRPPLRSFPGAPRTGSRLRGRGRRAAAPSNGGAGPAMEAAASCRQRALLRQVLGWRLAAAVAWSVLLLPACTAAFVLLGRAQPLRPLRWIAGGWPGPGALAPGVEPGV